MYKKHDWINDSDVRHDLVAETVVILYNDRDLGKMNFDVYVEHKDNNREVYSKADQQQLMAYEKSIKAAIEGAYKVRFGSQMDIKESEGKDLDILVNLVLGVYCKYKDENRLDEIVYNKK